MYALPALVLALPRAQAATQSLEPGRSASIGLLNESYLTPPGDGSSSNYPTLFGQVRGEKSGDLFEVRGEAEGMLLLQQGSPYGIEAPEAYFGTRQDLPVHARIGRKLENWSRLDEEWELGIFQPRFRWDYLHPESVGLNGLFVDATVAGGVRFLGWWSPIFIPERGMPIENRDGGFYSADRFFSGPATSLNIFGTPTPASYTVSAPPVSDIISHKSWGAMIQVGESQGPFLTAAYAYKPMNQLLFAYDGYLYIREGQITLYPEVAYHHVASLDLGYASKEVDAYLSYLDDMPDSQSFNGIYTYQTVTRSQAGSATVSVKPVADRDVKMNFSYLHQTGGNAPDSGPQATAIGSVFQDRYPYQDAMQGSISTPFPPSFIKGMSAKVKLLYDIGHTGTIWSTELDYHTKTSWLFRLGADVLSSAEQDTASSQDFISRFRANDRVYTGVSYVF